MLREITTMKMNPKGCMSAWVMQALSKMGIEKEK
jgi:hypothetical protein